MSIAPLSILLASQTTNAAAPFLASDVFGQTDHDGNPLFNNSDKNNHQAAAADSLRGPNGIAVDTIHHRLFTADAGNNRVLIYNLANDNTLIDTTADHVLGQPDFISSAADVSVKGFGSPASVAYDAANDRLFVADTTNSRILIFDTTTITDNEDAVNVLGQPDFISNSTDTNAKGFEYPRDIAYDPAHNRLFVTDGNNHRVLIFDTTTITDNEDAVNVLGQPDFFSNSSDTNAKGFNNPQYLAYDNAHNHLFVSDITNNRILIFDTTTITDNEDAVNVLGQPTFFGSNGDINAQGFGLPQGLAYDNTHNRLFVADYNINRILIFDTTTITDNEDAVNVLGQIDFDHGAPQTNANGFFNPQGLAYDATGNRLFVTDVGNNRALIFDTTTITDNEDAVNVMGQTDSNGNPDFTNGSANNMPFINNRGMEGPFSSVVDDTDHRLFVSDRWNSRVLIFNLNSNNNLVDRTADLVLGQADFNSSSCAATINSLCQPFGLAYESSTKRLFVSDKGNHRVITYDARPTVIQSHEDAVAVIGQASFTDASCGHSQSRLCQPFHLAIDDIHHLLFVGDKDNDRVAIFDTTAVTNHGQNAIYQIGQTNYNNHICYASGGGLPDASGLCEPRGVAVDVANHQLFVSDRLGHRVLEYDLSSSTGLPLDATADGVIGQISFITQTSGTSVNEFDTPNGLSLDQATRKLYVADEHNSRILLFDTSAVTSHGQNALAVLGQADFNSNDSDTSQSNLDFAVGVTVDTTNNRLYVADNFNNRVMIFDLAKISSTSLQVGSTDSSYSQSITTSSTQGTKTFSVTSGSLPPGLSLNSSTGAITGTPTTSGLYSFTIKLVDDNGAVGSFYDSKALTLAISNVSAATENAGPNNGDANNDGTPDSQQDNVISFVDPVTGQYVVLEVSCSAITNATAAAESANSTTDPAFDYPVGLIAFTAAGCTQGGDVTVKQYFYTNSTVAANQITQRKYDPTPNTYTTIPGAVASNLTIASKPVLKITYHITEGGSLDLDHTSNTSITDPSGPAINAAGVPNTGIGRGF